MSCSEQAITKAYCEPEDVKSADSSPAVLRNAQVILALCVFVYVYIYVYWAECMCKLFKNESVYNLIFRPKQDVKLPGLLNLASLTRDVKD